MKHKTADGKELFKVINIRVFSEHNAGSQLFRQRARPGQGFTEEAVDEFLERVADQVEQRFPQFEYSLVRLGQAHFNFVWKGYRKAPGTQEAAQA